MPNPYESHRDQSESLARHDERITQLLKAHQYLKENYITKQEFEPVKRAVYTTIGLIIAGLLGVVLHLILRP